MKRCPECGSHLVLHMEGCTLAPEPAEQAGEVVIDEELAAEPEPAPEPPPVIPSYEEWLAVTQAKLAANRPEEGTP